MAIGGVWMFGTRLRKLRKQNNLTMKELGRKLNLAESTISGYENGNRKPDMNIVQHFADYFGTSVDYLLGREMVKEPKSAFHQEFNLSDYLVRIPVLRTIRNRQSIMDPENIEGYELIERELLRGRDGIIIHIKDDSMIGDNIRTGDRAVIVIEEKVSPLDISVISLSGTDATIRRVKFQGDVCVITPSNVNVEPVLYSINKVKVIGKVVEVRHRFQ
jgi:repressor LexA